MQYIIPLLKSNKKRSEKLYAIKMWRRLSRSTGHWDNIACHSKHIYLWKSPCLIMANTHCLCKHHSTPCCSLSNWHTYIDSKCFLRSHISGTLWLFFVLHNSSYHVLCGDLARRLVCSLTAGAAPCGVSQALRSCWIKVQVFFHPSLLCLYGWLCRKKAVGQSFYTSIVRQDFDRVNQQWHMWT